MAQSATKGKVLSAFCWLKRSTFWFSIVLIAGWFNVARPILAQVVIPNEANAIFEDPETTESKSEISNSVNLIRQEQAFAKILKSSSVTSGNLSNTQDDLITYRLDITIADTSPNSDIIPTSLEGTNILLNGTSTQRILVSDVIPEGTTLNENFTPETPSGWEVVYSTDDPTNTIPVESDEDNALNAANWTTTQPPVEDITRIGFIFQGTLPPGETTEDTPTGLTFQVITGELPVEGGTVSNIAQVFGETLDDPENEIIYDESGDDQPNNFSEDGTEGEEFNPSDDTGVITGDEQGEPDIITIEPRTLTLVNGPENQPNAINNDENDDFSNLSTPLIPNLPLNASFNPDAVTFTNTLQNIGTTELTNVIVRPLSPQNADELTDPPGRFGENPDQNIGELPEGTIVTLTRGSQSITYTYNQSLGEFEVIDGSPISFDVLNVDETQDYEVTVDLPDGTSSLTGFSVPILAFVDENGNEEFDRSLETVTNLTIDRVYTGFIQITKDLRLLNSDGEEIFGFTETPPSDLPSLINAIIEYRLSYENLATLPQGDNAQGNQLLVAENFVIIEDGNANRNNWGDNTTHQQNTNESLGTVEFFDENNTSLGTTDPSDNTEVITYINEVGTLNPQQTGRFTFQRQVNSIPPSGNIRNRGEFSFEDNNGTSIDILNNFLTINLEPVKQAFAKLLKSSSVTSGNLSNTQDDLITYRLDITIADTSPNSDIIPTSLEGTNILLNGTPSTQRILVSDVIPEGTTLNENFTPETPSGWEVVYSTDDPTTTIPVESKEDNALSAAKWTTTKPPVEDITRIGFIFQGTLPPGETTENTENGLTFQVITSELPLEGGTVSNIAQVFGETLDDPENEIIYDESGDDQPNNFKEDGTEGNEFNPSEDTGVTTGDEQGEADLVVIELIDSFRQILGCDGTPLDDYNGFTVGLYRPNLRIPGEIEGLVPLTPTSGNLGVAPNINNNNPFALSTQTEGKFNFFLNEQQATTDATFVLVVSPPENSSFGERRIQVRLGREENDQIPFTAIALDGLPVELNSGNTQTSGSVSTVVGETLDQLGISIALSLAVRVCDRNSIRITKSSDRASASPGEIAVYRLRVENLATGNLDNLEITDTLPLGFKVIAESIQAEIGGETVELIIEQQPRTLTLELNEPFPENAILNIAYGTQLTPDALRGDGENAANVVGEDSRNGVRVQDGPAIHQMRVTGGILSDAGTIIGRVFVDKNFDGEQQPGEPGIPNAVVFLDNGMEVTTDADGLFSITNVLPGPRTGVLDLSSLQGYTLAPNQYFIERNSQSRLVNLPPGGTVRMNFAVTPVYNQQEEEQ